nr:peroxidase 16-like [Ipomoea batatas]
MEHKRKNSMVVASGMLVCLVLLVSSAHAQLRTDFYKNTCPNVESLGCDASVLLASPNGKAEKDHPDNLSLAGDGFDTVIKAKAAVDSNPQCRNKVSCADILALATRDVVSLVRAHTIGFSHCKHVAKRIYRFQPRSWIDPTLNLRYAFQLRQMCPLKVDPRIAINMDPTTPNTFDNAYFKNLQQGKGLFVSDQVLFTDRRSRNTVNFFASNNAAFHQAFAAAMTKLGRIGVLTGNLGEIRRDCTRPN